MSYSEDDKYDIILGLIKDPSEGERLAKKYDIALSTLYKWRSRFLEGGRDELANYKTGPKRKARATEKEKVLQQRVQEYEEKIARLSTENEILKKKENWTGGPLL